MRIPPDQLARLDVWVTAQPDTLSRPEVIRQLLDRALMEEMDRAVLAVFDGTPASATN